MPNWCNNTVEFVGDEQAINKIALGFQSEKPFESIIGKDPSFTEEDWYNHNHARYGTKWDIEPLDPSEVHLHCLNLSTMKRTLSVSFSTAWSPPNNFVAEVCRQYGVEANIQYLESGNDFAGEIIFDTNGEVESKFEYTYLEGVYTFDKDLYWTNEVEWILEQAHDELITADALLKQHPYLNEEDKQQLKQRYIDYEN